MALSESNPALAGFYDAQAAPEQQFGRQLGNLTGILSLQQHLQQQREGEAIKGILSSDLPFAQKLEKISTTGPTGITVATHLAGLEKAKQDNAMFERFTGGAGTAGTGGMTNPQLNDLGTLLAVRGHPGAATVMGIADKRDKAAADATALTSMRSAPAIPPDVQETQQAADQGTPSVATVPARQGVVPDYLLQDSIFGKSAAALKSRIDSGAVGTAAAAEKEVDRMNTAYTAWLQRQQAAGTAQAGREKLKAMAPGVNDQGILTEAARKAAAERYKIDGTLPTNLGRGNQGAVNTALILNDAATSSAQEGDSPEAQRLRQIANKSSAVALTAVQKDLAAIGPFHDMLNTNAKVAIDLAKKISNSRTGSQWVNAPISQLQLKGSDNPDIAEYLFQMNVVKTEGARILNNPRLVGQLTDSARHEMGDVINGNMPLGQTERVLKRMMTDGDNRVNAIQAQRDSLVRGMGRGAQGASTGALTAQEQQELDTLRKRFGR